MAFTLNTVTEFGTEPGSLVPRLIRTNFYLRLRGEDAEAPLFLQGGGVYGESGAEIPEDERPAWLAVEMAKCTPEALRAVGFEPPARAATKRATREAVVTPDEPIPETGDKPPPEEP